MSADLDKMKKATQAVYLACEASVADDISAMLKAAIDEIERLRNQLAALPDDKRASEDGWRPIETAPVEPYETVSDYYRFRCLLQDSKGDVFEGYGYYVKLGRATTHKTLRWASKHGQCFPKYWRPMPAPFQPTPSREPRPAGGAPASSEEE